MALPAEPRAGGHLSRAGIPEGLIEAPEELEQRVTPLELFFDLVFVFAITQVTGYVSARPSWTRLIEGLAILAVLWFAWSAYAWLGNTAHTDDGLVRVILLAAMAAMLIASLAVPHALGRYGLIFGVAYFVVRALHVGCYAAVARARNDRVLLTVVWRLGSTMLPAAALLVVAGALSGIPRALCWVAALTVDYGGLLVRGVQGWRVQPGHFAERHSAVIIIALGESIVALGVGAAGVRLNAGEVVGVLLGMAIAGALWWAYFEIVAIIGERRLRRADARAQVLMARDSYTYLHLPMITGIILFAIGVKRTLLHVSGHLHPVIAAALCGGVALYLVALSAFKRRNIGSLNRPRLVVAAVLCCLIPATTRIPALAALGIVTASACGLITFEFLRYSETRERIRHGAPALHRRLPLPSPVRATARRAAPSGAREHALEQRLPRQHHTHYVASYVVGRARPDGQRSTSTRDRSRLRYRLGSGRHHVVKAQTARRRPLRWVVKEQAR